MKITKNNKTINFEISEDCIDVYLDNKLAGDFDITNESGYVTITPNSIDLENIGLARKGFYTEIIDTILEGTLNDEIEEQFEDYVKKITFQSIKRTEKACNFWNKRGYKVEYDKKEHEKGEQEIIEIEII